MSKKPLPEQKKEFFEEHLIYEITLMREAYKLALAPKPWAEHNCHIVAFLNASRNLIEFFKNKPSCDFDPRFFTKSTYQLETRFLRDSLLPLINSQISHLTSKRTRVMKDKIGEKLWKEIHEELEAEITRFEKALSKEYEDTWKLKPGPTLAVAPTSDQSSAPTWVVSGPTGPSAPGN
jgi:hypothetical protein